jgi:hypothetical protein
MDLAGPDQEVDALQDLGQGYLVGGGAHVQPLDAQELGSHGAKCNNHYGDRGNVASEIRRLRKAEIRAKWPGKGPTGPLSHPSWAPMGEAS